MNATSADPVGVGLIGAGPWARMFHAPMLTAGPETRLVGVWSRRSDASQELASLYGVVAFQSPEALIEASEAVAICVPPAHQADFAVKAAQAGRSILLEKPVADSVEGARRIAEAVNANGVGSVIALTWRYSPEIRQMLRQAQATRTVGGRAWIISGDLISGPFASSRWRHSYHGLLDIAPHVIDVMDFALGPVVEIEAHVSERGWISVRLEHAEGQRSDLSLCCRADVEHPFAGIEVYGAGGRLHASAPCSPCSTAASTMRAELAHVTRATVPHPCDARRGLYLQSLIAKCLDSAALHYPAGHRDIREVEPIK